MCIGSGGTSGTPGNEESATYRFPERRVGSNPTYSGRLTSTAAGSTQRGHRDTETDRNRVWVVCVGDPLEDARGPLRPTLDAWRVLDIQRHRVLLPATNLVFEQQSQGRPKTGPINHNAEAQRGFCQQLSSCSIVAVEAGMSHSKDPHGPNDENVTLQEGKDRVRCPPKAKASMSLDRQRAALLTHLATRREASTFAPGCPLPAATIALRVWDTIRTHRATETVPNGPKQSHRACLATLRVPRI
jgi:hypothetical protein